DSFTFQVQDDGGTANGGVDLDASPNTLTIDVTAVNDAPAGTDTTVTATEDTDYVFTAADFGFGDPTDGGAHNLAGVVLTTLTGTGTLLLSGGGVIAGQSITVADINAGNLVFRPVAEANGAGYDSFTFQVQDDGGTANGGVDLDASPNTLTIDVTAVNDAPTQSLGTDVLGVADSSNTGALTVPAQVSTLLTNSGAADVADGDPVGIAVVGATRDNLWEYSTNSTDGVNGTWTALNVVGAVTGSNAVTLLGTAWVRFSPPADGSSAPDEDLTYRAWDGTDGSGNGATGVDASAQGGANAFSTNDHVGQFDVEPVNSPPAGADNTVTGLEDTDYVFTAADFGFSDPNDAPADSLQGVRLTTLTGSGALLLGGGAVSAGQTITVTDINAGNLTFRPVADASGAGYDSFTFQVQDDGGTANGGVDLDASPNTLIIDVTAVNDAPAGTDTTVTALEDTDYVFTAADFGFGDPNDAPADSLQGVMLTTLTGSGTLLLSGGGVIAGQSISVVDINAGNLTFRPVADASGAGYDGFTFQVQDDGGTANGGVDLDASPNTLTIDVTAVNDAPAGTDTTVTAIEDTDYVFTAADFGFGDPTDGGAHNLAGVVLTTLTGTGTLLLSGGGVIAGQSISVADINAGNLTFRPVADASGAGYDSFTFQVQDDGGTANGGVDLDA
ncbi:MAG: hypothetical protein GY788_23635, partial [bacterium]|nr:hypothetical protein [bacterium]